IARSYNFFHVGVLVTVDAFFGQPPQSIWGWEAAASAEECRRFAVTLAGANARLGAEVVSLLLPRGGLAPLLLAGLPAHSDHVSLFQSAASYRPRHPSVLLPVFPPIESLGFPTHSGRLLSPRDRRRNREPRVFARDCWAMGGGAVSRDGHRPATWRLAATMS